MKLDEKLSKISIWREIPMDIRKEMRKDLDIKQATGVEVRNNRVVNDGVTELSLVDVKKSLLVKVLKEGVYTPKEEKVIVEEVKVEEPIKPKKDEEVKKKNTKSYFKESI